MPTITRFEDLEIWQKARTLSYEIFKYSREGGFKRDYKLIDQINAASGSIMDNISEGFERSSRLEFINFLTYAKGSTGEVKSQLIRALDRKYLDQEKFSYFYGYADELTKQITSFISYLNKSNIKGQKFKNR
ncbi:MAG: four helix bundle protein [Chitinophagaceae bacterium]|nr:four helix bundle protein [Chitinophagaceae bacterium]